MSASPILIPFEPFHLNHYTPGLMDKVTLADMDITALSRNWEGRAVSAILNGRVIGIAGIGKVRDGVGRGWVFLSDEARKHPIFLHRTVKRGLDLAFKELGLETIEVAVEDCFETGIRWAERLGFEYHGRKIRAEGKEFLRMTKCLSQQQL